jgi:hypothetical protein
MSDTGLDVNPRDVVRQFRQTYTNAHLLRKRVPNALPDTVITKPQETPINEGDLPEGIRSLLNEYRRKHPHFKLAFLKYQHIEDGKPIKIIEDESPLPEEDKFLSLSQTATLTTNTEVRVITDIVVASIGPA